MEDYEEHDAVGLADLVARGEVSPAELVREAQRRIEDHDPTYGFIAHRFDAEVALTALPSSGPFRGVPFLLKDQLEVAGQPMTLGSRLLKDWTPPHTHPLASRFVETGLVPLGRTTMSELGLLPTSESAAFGVTHNPWAKGYSPGGSSGGAAVAVTAGVVPIAHAVDGGGSIRIPASACGLIGLKPSRGRHPGWADDPPQGFVSHFAVTRTVRDTAALLDATYVSAGRFRLPAPEVPYASVIERDPAPLRIGLTPTGLFGEAPHPEVLASLTSTVEQLVALGHTVEEVRPPLEVDRFVAAFRVLWATAAGIFLAIAQRDAPLPSWLRPLTRPPTVFRLLTALSGGVEPFTRRLARLQQALAPTDLWLAEMDLEAAAASLQIYFETYDLWLTPTLLQPPPKHGFFDLGLSDEALGRQIFGLIGFTAIANGTGIPAISLPAGLAAGLPVGVQFMAPMGREDRLLALAGQLERASSPDDPLAWPVHWKRFNEAATSGWSS
ncbi:MAG: amidase family protein [Myxococcota bacterium]